MSGATREPWIGRIQADQAHQADLAHVTGQGEDRQIPVGMGDGQELHDHGLAQALHPMPIRIERLVDAILVETLAPQHEVEGCQETVDLRVLASRKVVFRMLWGPGLP